MSDKLSKGTIYIGLSYEDPFIVTKNSKEALREQAVAMLMFDLKRAEERAKLERLQQILLFRELEFPLKARKNLNFIVSR